MPIYDWTAAPAVEADTLYLLDTDVEGDLTPGDGGLIMGNAPGGDLPPWLGGTKMSVVAGEHRDGLRSLNSSGGFMFMPVAGLIGAAKGSLEFWLTPDGAWSAVNGAPFTVTSQHDEGITCLVASGVLTVYYSHQQDVAAHVSTSCSGDLTGKSSASPAHVLFTWDSGTLQLYVDGTLKQQRTGVAMPSVWSDAVRAGGLEILGTNGTAMTGVILDSLRISRTPRRPGENYTADGANTLTVNSGTPAGTLNSAHGFLHATEALTQPVAARYAEAAFLAIRTDKMLTATPIKAGGVDGTHTYLGASGAYSYNMAVVDRSIGRILELGATPYLSIDSHVQVLGGNVAPLSGSTLTDPAIFAGNGSNFAPAPISDTAEYAKIVRDLVHYVANDMPSPQPGLYWSLWNEPDGPDFWTDGDADAYNALYAAVAPAVKLGDPTAKIGGPEVASSIEAESWATSLITYCAANDLPLDFASAHFYSGNLGDFDRFRAVVSRQCAAEGIADIEVINGEWGWNMGAIPGTGQVPFANFDHLKDAYGAAFWTHSMIRMHANDYVHGVWAGDFGTIIAEPDATGWSPDGGFGTIASDGTPWALHNAMLLWNMVGSDLVDTDADLIPGIAHLASADSSTGRVRVLLASLHYHEQAAATVIVELPDVPDGSAVTAYIIDPAHSNRVEAGDDHAALETVTVGAVSGGQVQIEMASRSVAVLDIQSGVARLPGLVLLNGVASLLT